MKNLTKLVLTLVLLVTFGSSSFAMTTWYVASLDVPGNGDGSQRSPFRTIQQGIDAAVDGDLVLVRRGRYPEAIDFLGKEIEVRSVDGPSATTLIGDGTEVVVRIAGGQSRATKLIGFTITGGEATIGGGIICIGSSPTIQGNVIRENYAERGCGIACFDGSAPRIEGNEILENGLRFCCNPFAGGGIYCARGSDAEIVGNLIRLNEAHRGAGIACFASSPLIDGNRIEDNTAASRGGGVICEDGASPEIRNNKILFNRASGNGAGIHCNDAGTDPLIQSNRIRANRITAGGTARDGGAIAVYDDAAPTITDNEILDNESRLLAGGILVKRADSVLIEGNEIRGNRATINSGGGIVFNDGSATVRGNLIADNFADDDGGGVLLILGAGGVFTNNWIVGNEAAVGGGVRGEQATTRFVNNTISDNVSPDRAGGVSSVDSGLGFENCIIWGNSREGSGSEIELESGPIEITYSNVGGGWPGEANLDVDPAFVHAPNGDYRLRIGSRCVDRGNNSAPEIPDTDFEGDDRVQNGDRGPVAVVDLGADEMTPAVAARFGTVNATGEGLLDVLRLNDSRGDSRREITVGAGTRLELAMSAPPAPSTARFALYAFAGEPTLETLAVQPARLGVMTFATPLNDSSDPLLIWNNTPYGRLGEADQPSSPAPSIVFDLAGGRPPGVVTFQGFIEDDGSAADVPLSITNAIVLRIE